MNLSPFLKGAIFSGAAAPLLGTGALTLILGMGLVLPSSEATSATQMHPAKSKVTCDKYSAACFEAENSGENGVAVYGLGAGPGATGLLGESTAQNGSGVVGSAKNGVAGGFGNDSSTYYALYGVNDNAYGSPFEALNASNDAYFTVDAFGDGLFTGTVTAANYITGVRTRHGGLVGAGVAMTPQATMEDTGTSRLVNGESAVRFDPAFANTIDASRGYQVFLTPNGETRGWLYVTEKFEGGFIVREALHGRSSVYFDYRIVAHPYGASNARLPRLNIKPPQVPRLTLRAAH